MTNTKEYKDLCAQYNWFAENYPPAVQKACDDFFLEGIQFVLEGISKNINTLMDKDAYFVTKIRIDKLHDMFFRISEKAVELLLNKALGKSNSKFNLNKLTDLEAKIITSFNDYMYNSVSEFLSPAPPILKRTNFDVIHLTFLVKDVKANNAAKFVITLPEVLLNPEMVVSNEEKFSYKDFSSSLIDVSLKVGTTKFKLIDVKNIEIDDIVVFDNSSVNHMVLKFKDYEKEINLNPNLGLVFPVDNEEDSMSDDANQSLWDSIEVEMNAQFDAVKITLGELKNIEEGLVVDLTSIYDNKVTLSIENKPIARGSLVIVNDRYGVKIDEVVTKSEIPQEESIQDDNQIDDYSEEEFNDEYSEENFEEQPSEENQEEDDEFDYSDFELEDEDI